MSDYPLCPTCRTRRPAEWFVTRTGRACQSCQKCRDRYNRRSRHRHGTRVCEICGRSYAATGRDQRSCSRICGGRLASLNAAVTKGDRAEQQAKRLPDAPRDVCPSCTQEYVYDTDYEYGAWFKTCGCGRTWVRLRVGVA